MNQKSIPNKDHNVIKLIFNMMGGTYPLLMIQGVMNLEKPYPQRFLFTVMLTKMAPDTGL